MLISNILILSDVYAGGDVGSFASEETEYLFVTGITSLIAYGSWTKMTLGAILAFLGACYPDSKNKGSEEAGEAKFSSNKFSLSFRGGLRFSLIIAGCILLIGSVIH